MKQTARGFTIVELLIVIVVIAILAAVSIVAYNGIQQRTRASVTSNALSQSAKKIKTWQVENENTSPTCAKFYELVTGKTDISTCQFDYSGLSYQYSPGTNGSYCATATVSNVSYKTTDGSTPTSGGCSGHAANGNITNFATNPSSELTEMTLSSGGGGSSTSVRTSAEKYSGDYSTILTKSGNWAYVRSNMISVVPGDVVTTCAWVKSAYSNIRIVRRGSGIPYTTSYPSLSSGSWSKVCDTYTIPSGASTFYHDFGWENGNAPDGTIAYIDGVMVTKSSQAYEFADGNSPGWSWSGTANNSSSFGPSL